MGRADSSPYNVLVDLPIGAGKTLTGLTIASLLQRSTGCSIVWITASEERSEELHQENRRRGLGVRMQLHTFDSPHPIPRGDLLVLDDSHHLTITQLQRLRHEASPFWSLALASSPFRSERLHRNFDRTIRSTNTQRLVDAHFLSQHHHFTIPEHSPHAIAGLLIGQADRFGKSVVYFDRKSDAELLYLLLSQAGVQAALLHTSSDQSKRWSDLSSNRIEVLIDSAQPIKTFRCADLKTVFCRPGGRAGIRQMASRVLQPSPAHPIKQIVQTNDTTAPTQRWVQPERQFILKDGVWHSDHFDAPFENEIAFPLIDAPSLA